MNETTISSNQSREVFRIEEDFVAAHVPGLRARMKEIMAAGVQRLTLDLSRVQMVDSTGIGLLISAHNSLQKAGGSLELTHVAPEIRELFRTMRLNQHFRISGDE